MHYRGKSRLANHPSFPKTHDVRRTGFHIYPSAIKQRHEYLVVNCPRIVAYKPVLRNGTSSVNYSTYDSWDEAPSMRNGNVYLGNI